MNFTVMSATEWYCKFVAYLAPERAALSKSQMVCIGRAPAANQAGSPRNELHVLSVADPSRFKM
jgi:hypothetical protein